MFRVEWVDEAIDELAAIWTHADSDKRRAVTEANNMIDRELKADPFRQSESRDEDRRVLFAAPLGVFFKVDVEHRIPISLCKVISNSDLRIASCGQVDLVVSKTGGQRKSK